MHPGRGWPQAGTLRRMTSVALVVYAVDVARLAAFYRGAFELEVAEGDDTYAVLAAPGVELVVQRIPPWIAADIVVSDPPEVREDTPIKPVFRVDDLDSAVARFAAAGGRLRGSDTVWTFRGRVLRDGWDPEGNVVQLSGPAG